MAKIRKARYCSAIRLVQQQEGDVVWYVCTTKPCKIPGAMSFGQGMHGNFSMQTLFAKLLGFFVSS